MSAIRSGAREGAIQAAAAREATAMSEWATTRDLLMKSSTVAKQSRTDLNLQVSIEKQSAAAQILRLTFGNSITLRTQQTIARWSAAACAARMGTLLLALEMSGVAKNVLRGFEVLLRSFVRRKMDSIEAVFISIKAAFVDRVRQDSNTNIAEARQQMRTLHRVQALRGLQTLLIQWQHSALRTAVREMLRRAVAWSRAELYALHERSVREVSTSSLAKDQATLRAAVTQEGWKTQQNSFAMERTMMAKGISCEHVRRVLLVRSWRTAALKFVVNALKAAFDAARDCAVADATQDALDSATDELAECRDGWWGDRAGGLAVVLHWLRSDEPSVLRTLQRWLRGRDSAEGADSVIQVSRCLSLGALRRAVRNQVASYTQRFVLRWRRQSEAGRRRFLVDSGRKRDGGRAAAAVVSRSVAVTRATALHWWHAVVLASRQTVLVAVRCSRGAALKAVARKRPSRVLTNCVSYWRARTRAAVTLDVSNKGWQNYMEAVTRRNTQARAGIVHTVTGTI